jgi:hypothetical protein
MAAPARQAANPCSIISGGCSGRLGFASLPCWAPVKAHVIITLPIFHHPMIEAKTQASKNILYFN